MKITWKWLQQWVDLDGLDIDEVVDRLTMAGLEVDGVERLGEGSDDIVVARIERIREHPNADKLVLCDVEYGGDELTQVVCGAKNMGEGDLVPLALPGSQPPGVDFEIVSRKVRGEMSSGMLCSAEELDLAEESAGLMILPADFEIGRPVFEALDLKDAVIEIDLTPNRPDCLGHRGVARDLAALYDRERRRPAHFGEQPAWESTDDTKQAAEAAGLHVEDAEGCPRYLFAVIEGVEVGPSPTWLKTRLAALGLRSVNNIVDVTNYVLMDVNQPLHAFDLDKLQGPEIRVRRAEAGEKMTGIDHNEYELDPEDLVIADAERPVAIAGVMGGVDTEVSETTSRILLECAYFDPTTVRKSARRHALHTDSSHRFERGIDPAALPEALAHAVHLLLDVHEGTDAEPTVRLGVAEQAKAGIDQPATTRLDRDHSRRVLGTDVSDEQVVDYLSSIGVNLEDDGDAWICELPTFRPDLTRPIDLVEEVARLYGYDAIEATLPRAPMGFSHSLKEGTEYPPTIVDRAERDLLGKMRTQLLSYGLYEVVNYGFMSDDDLDALNIADDDRRRETVVLANPLIAADRFMQTTLLPGLLDNLATNLAQRSSDVALFETGRRYFPDRERPTLALLLSGRQLRHWSGDKEWDFFDLKGLIEAIAGPFDTASLRWDVPETLEPYMHPGVQASWSSLDKTIACAGQLHPAVAAEMEIDQDVYLAEVHLDSLFGLGRPTQRFAPMSRFPAVTRDFALIYGTDEAYSQIEEAIEELAVQNEAFGELLESYDLFDVYTGEQVADEMRSLALTVVYRSPEQTLTDSDIEQADRTLVEWLEEQVDATLR